MCRAVSAVASVYVSDASASEGPVVISDYADALEPVVVSDIFAVSADVARKITPSMSLSIPGKLARLSPSHTIFRSIVER